MTRTEAIKVLEDHNKWRCDNSVPSVYESTEPKKLTEAINTAISELKSDLLPIVISTLRVCATGCNGIVVNGVCNSCKADWR